MSKDLFFDAMDYIDDSMIEAVDALRRSKKSRNRTWRRWASMAACLCIVAGCVLVGIRFLDSASDSISCYDDSGASDLASGSGGTENSGVTIPKTEIKLDPNASADLLAFFIYEGRMYIQYEWIYGHSELAGEYVGTATGEIDCLTSKEDYVDFAGSVAGDFYTVDGFDPSFMLCMKYENGSVATYINDNGMTLYHGSDLFEDRLHLVGNYTAVEYQTRADWYDSLGNVKRLYGEADSASAEVVESFIAELNRGEFMYTEDVPLDKGQSSIYDRELYHLFFRMKNGMTVHLRLYDGGYVRYQGLIPVCVKMDEAAFDALIELLK